MDPTKASLIPSSPSLEADNNALEKKSDDVIQPAKIKYSLPADHVNRELKFPLEKNIKSTAPKDIFFEFSGIQSTPFKIQKPSSGNPSVDTKTAHNVTDHSGGHQLNATKKTLTTHRYPLKNHPT